MATAPDCSGERPCAYACASITAVLNLMSLFASLGESGNKRI